MMILQLAKQLQAEAEEIQKKIDNQLHEAKSETDDLIKSATSDFQSHATKELQQLDDEIDKKLEKSASLIEKNKIESLNKINSQIYEITKLTLSQKFIMCQLMMMKLKKWWIILNRK